MKCCGEIRDTKYCPDCGKMLKDSTLFGLAQYLDRQREINDAHTKSHKHAAEVWSNHGPSRQKAAKRRQRLSETTAAKAEQFKAWHDMITAIIAKDDC